MDIISHAALLGLSTGMYCLGFCLPVLFPLFFAEEQPSLKTRGGLLVKFLSGRLLAYLLFGAVIGFLGQTFDHPITRKVTAGAILITSIMLVVYGLLSGSPHKKICLTMKKRLPLKGFAFLMGIFTGFNICPPFLLALGYVFQLGEISKGLMFFFIFFLITSLYTIPMIFVGYYAKFEKLRWVAQMSAIIAGVMFFWMGTVQLLV